jgi:hypothetical protein
MVTGTFVYAYDEDNDWFIEDAFRAWGSNAYRRECRRKIN